MESGHHLEPHSHTTGQLVYAVAGVVVTTTARGTWLAPANRATWTPPGFEHSHRFYGRTDVRVVTIRPDECGALPTVPGVLEVNPLLREALVTLTGRPARGEADDRLQAVIIDEIIEARQQPLHLPEPRDDRLRSLAGLLHQEPAQSTTLEEFGVQIGASARTLSRLIHDEIGMSFQRWRTVMRIHHAVVALTDGRSVTATAIACGWSNPSSFIDAFTELVGQTPGRYRAALGPALDTTLGRRRG